MTEWEIGRKAAETADLLDGEEDQPVAESAALYS
jgi:hypothetical protein